MRKVGLALAALLLLTNAVWSLAGPPPVALADGGTFPDQPFNGMQIQFNVSGATLGTFKDSGSFDWVRRYSGGVTTGKVLTVSGAAIYNGGCRIEVDIAVTGGDSHTDPPGIRKPPDDKPLLGPLKESFNLSAPIPPTSMQASFDIKLWINCSGNMRSLRLIGVFEGPGARIPTPTPYPNCLAKIIVPPNLQPGDVLAPTAEVSDPNGKTVQPKKMVWLIDGKETNSKVWDGNETLISLQVTCPDSSVVTKELRIPRVTPKAIKGRVYATDMLTYKPNTLPVSLVQVVLLRKDKVLASTYTDDDGAFTLGAPVTDSLTISVSLSLKGASPGFVVVYGTSLVPASLTTKPFDLTKESPNPTKMDISFFDSSATVPGRGIPANRMNDLAAIYYYTYQAWKTAVVSLKLQFDYDMPLFVRASGPCGTDTFWAWPRFFSDLPDHPAICLGGSDSSSFEPGLAFAVFHEFGHHVMADAFGNALPDRGNSATAHDGFRNPSSIDSWIEGFASFYAALVQRETLKQERPELLTEKYGWTLNAEVNTPPWLTWGRSSLEEFAVMGLLWDLVDPVDKDDNTPMMAMVKDPEDGSPWPRSIGITLSTPIAQDKPAAHYADYVQMDLLTLWSILTSDNSNLDPSPEAPSGYKYIYDVRQLYSVLKANGVGANQTPNGITGLDELFIAHGFFADMAPQNLYYDRGEAIGFTNNLALTIQKVSYPPRSVRRTPPIPDSYIGFDAVDAAGDKADVNQFKVEVRFDAPYQKYSYTFNTTSAKPGLLFFVSPDPRYPVKTYVSVAGPNHESTAPLVVSNDLYWKKMTGSPQGSFMTHTFQVKPKDNGLFGWLGSLPGGPALLLLCIPVGLVGVVAPLGLVGGIWFLRRRPRRVSQLPRERRKQPATENRADHDSISQASLQSPLQDQSDARPPATRFCGKCGKPVAAGAAFCGGCGGPLRGPG